MTYLLASVRIVLVLVIILVTAVLTLLTALIPIKVREARPALWVIVWATRLFNLLFNVRVVCDDVYLLRQHRGFIFMNHLSFIEILAMLSLMPVRFLSAMELRTRPVIGWIAQQVGTIFVQREDKASRRAARRTIARIVSRSALPPVVVFPEGRLGSGNQINSFRYGIFETACRSSTPYLLCALWYNRPDIAIWKGALGESLVGVAWRLARFRGPLIVELRPVLVFEPSPDDDPQRLATAAQQAVATELGLPVATEERVNPSLLHE